MRTFQHGKGRMPLVQVAYLGLEAKRLKQTPTTDAEYQLLLQPQLTVAAI